jgi:hypothetical protein
MILNYVCENHQCMLRLGIIGNDPLLVELIPTLREKGDLQIRGIFSASFESSSEISRDLLMQAFLVPETLILKSDAILIFDDPAEYYDLLVRSIQMSKHLFFRDLGSLKLGQIESLMKLASEARVVLYCILPSASIDVLASLKELVYQPVFIEMAHTRHYDPGGLSLDSLKKMVSESVDALLYLNPTGVLRVQAHSGAIASGHHDFIHARMDFSNGCLGLINISLTGRETQFLFRGFQAGRIIEANLIESRIKQISFGPDRTEKIKKGSGQKKDQEMKKTEKEIGRFCGLIFDNSSSTASFEKALFSHVIAQKILDKIQVPVSA